MGPASKIKISLQPDQIPRSTLDALRRGNVLQFPGQVVLRLNTSKEIRTNLEGWWLVTRLKQIHDSQPLHVWLERAGPR